MTLFSSREITRSIAVPSTFELLSPSVCSMKGLNQLVSHHALQLADNQKKALERIADEEERLLFHLLLLLFDGDWSHADTFITQMKQKRNEVVSVGVSDQVSSKNDNEMSTACEVVPELVSSSPKDTSVVDDTPIQSASEVHNESIALDQSSELQSESVLPIQSASETCDESCLPSQSTSAVQKESVISVITPPEHKNDLSPSEVHNKVLPKPNTESIPSSPKKCSIPSTISQQPVSSPRKTVVQKGTAMRGRRGVFLRYHPDYREFFDWWLDDGINKEAVEMSMRSEGYDSTVHQLEND